MNSLASRSGLAALCFGVLGALQTSFAAAVEIREADLANPEFIAAGKKRFARSCFYCHGQEGAGGKGAPLQRRPDLTPDLIFNTISNGRVRGSATMPPWKNTLSEEEIVQLVAYIVSLRDMPEPK
ncbi:MAG TPA: cytochrome c [Burkholderiales bacterium]|nr:cytochrome c [Burkholderiales bacterium]